MLVLLCLFSAVLSPCEACNGLAKASIWLSRIALADPRRDVRTLKTARREQDPDCSTGPARCAPFPFANMHVLAVASLLFLRLHPLFKVCWLHTDAKCLPNACCLPNLSRPLARPPFLDPPPLPCSSLYQVWLSGPFAFEFESSKWLKSANYSSA